MKTPPPKWFKFVTDFGPIVVFFIVYKFSNLMVATAFLIPAAFLALAAEYLVHRRIAPVPLITFVLVGTLGGLTLALGDGQYVKMKPTIVEGLFSAIMFFAVFTKRPLLRLVVGEALRLTDEGWHALTFRFAFFFLLMAALNEVVWRNFPEDLWVDFKVFGITGLTFVFMLSQAGLIKRHQLPAEPEAGGSQVS